VGLADVNNFPYNCWCGLSPCQCLFPNTSQNLHPTIPKPASRHNSNNNLGYHLIHLEAKLQTQN